MIAEPPRVGVREQPVPKSGFKNARFSLRKAIQMVRLKRRAAMLFFNPPGKDKWALSDMRAPGQTTEHRDPHMEGIAERELRERARQNAGMHLKPVGDSSSSYILQGDTNLQTVSAWEARLLLRVHPAVEAELERWWAVICKSYISASAPVQELQKGPYIDLQRSLYRALVEGDYDDKDARKCGEESWTDDCPSGASGLNRKAFMDCIFELADVWTPNIDSGEYADFLRTLLARISTGNPPRIRQFFHHDRPLATRSASGWPNSPAAAPLFYIKSVEPEPESAGSSDADGSTPTRPGSKRGAKRSKRGASSSPARSGSPGAPAREKSPSASSRLTASRLLGSEGGFRGESARELRARLNAEKDQRPPWKDPSPELGDHFPPFDGPMPPLPPPPTSPETEDPKPPWSPPGPVRLLIGLPPELRAHFEPRPLSPPQPRGPNEPSTRLSTSPSQLSRPLTTVPVPDRPFVPGLVDRKALYTPPTDARSYTPPSPRLPLLPSRSHFNRPLSRPLSIQIQNSPNPLSLEDSVRLREEVGFPFTPSFSFTPSSPFRERSFTPSSPPCSPSGVTSSSRTTQHSPRDRTPHPSPQRPLEDSHWPEASAAEMLSPSTWRSTIEEDWGSAMVLRESLTQAVELRPWRPASPARPCSEACLSPSASTNTCTVAGVGGMISSMVQLTLPPFPLSPAARAVLPFAPREPRWTASSPPPSTYRPSPPLPLYAQPDKPSEEDERAFARSGAEQRLTLSPIASDRPQGYEGRPNGNEGRPDEGRPDEGRPDEGRPDEGRISSRAGQPGSRPVSPRNRPVSQVGSSRLSRPSLTNASMPRSCTTLHSTTETAANTPCRNAPDPSVPSSTRMHGCATDAYSGDALSVISCLSTPSSHSPPPLSPVAPEPLTNPASFQPACDSNWTAVAPRPIWSPIGAGSPMSDAVQLELRLARRGSLSSRPSTHGRVRPNIDGGKSASASMSFARMPRGLAPAFEIPNGQVLNCLSNPPLEVHAQGTKFGAGAKEEAITLAHAMWALEMFAGSRRTKQMLQMATPRLRIPQPEIPQPATTRPGLRIPQPATPRRCHDFVALKLMAAAVRDADGVADSNGDVTTVSVSARSV